MKLLRNWLNGLVLAAALALGLCGSTGPGYAQFWWSSPTSANAPAVALTDPAVAQRIVVQGATRGDENTIKNYFTGTDQASVNRAVADLSATGIYSKVNARIEGDHVIVSVVESANIVNRVAFEGENKIKSDQLAVEVESKARAPFSESVANADVDRIKGAYKKLGYNDTQVSYRLVNLPNGRVDLVFTIKESDKTGVHDINFVGNNAISSYRLHNLMQTTTMNFMSWFKTTDIYNPDQLASDEEAIRKYYMRNGFADFRITNTDVVYHPELKGYVITITVDEGPLYHVSSVTVTSNLPHVDGAALQKFVRLRPGDVYDAAAVDRSVEAMTRDLARQGYAFSQVRPHGDRDNATHQIALAFTVDDGPKVYIERIDIVGNTRTRDYVIRREFDIGEGDPYNHTMIELAERRLNGLGYFKSVHISTRPGASPDRVIVTVAVEDKPTGSLSLSGGFSTVEGFLAEVAFTETNFLGRGQYVKLSATAGQYSRGWGISFTEPYFLDQRLAAGFDIFEKQQFENLYALYNTQTLGANFRLGIPITNEFTVQPNYSIYESSISIPNNSSQPYADCNNSIVNGLGSVVWTTPGAGPAIATPDANCLTNGEVSVAIKDQAAQGNILTSLVGYSLIWDNVDNRRNPTTGGYLTFHQDFAGLGGQSDFVRETIDGRYYYPITDDFVGFVRLQGGQINGWGSQQLPILDNFNLGPGLVRGFAPGGIGPRDISDLANVAANGLGGTTYVGGTAEVQFPLFGTPKELGLKGALFVDAGTLVGFSAKTDYTSLLNYTTPGKIGPQPYCPKSGSTFGNNPLTQPTCLTVWDPNQIRASVGVSLLWASPMGPIRFDLALPFLKGTYDQTQIFNFTGGTTF
jgi:outer membrane protein insertion porin family